MLLIVVFAMSITGVIAEDTSDVSDALSTADADEVIAATDGADETLGAADESLSADDIPESGSATDGIDATFCSVEVKTPDKDFKVGDKVKVQIKVTNIGIIPAEDVVVGLSFTDLPGNPAFGFKLVDDGGYAISQVEGGYEIKCGFLAPNDSKTLTLTFLATEPGEFYAVASATGSNVENSDEAYDQASIIVKEDSSSAAGSNNGEPVASKNLATGNPLALLALALFTLVPYCRRG